MKLSTIIALLAPITLTFASTNDIHQINFKNNFRYRPACLHFADSSAEVKQWQLSGVGESVVVKNGVFKKNNHDDPMDFRVLEIAYGNLNSNNVAVVSTVCNTGGSGDFSDGFIYGMVNEKPKLLAVIDGGDRANGGIHSATIKNGLVQVERYGTDGGACCPEWTEIRNYQLRDGKLVEVGVMRRGKYVEPVSEVLPVR